MTSYCRDDEDDGPESIVSTRGPSLGERQDEAMVPEKGLISQKVLIIYLTIESSV